MPPLSAMAFSFSRSLDWCARKLFKLSVVCCGLLALPICVDVLARVLYGGSVDGVVELEEFLFCLMVFAAICAVQCTKDHIKVDLILSRLSEQSIQAVFIHHWLLTALVYGLLSWQLFSHAWYKHLTGEYSYVYMLSLWPFLVFGGLCCALLCLILLRDAAKSLVSCLKAESLGLACLALVAVGLAAAAPFLLSRFGLTNDKLALGAVAFLYLLMLIFSGMPIGFAMAVVGGIGLLSIHPNLNAALSMLGIGTYATATSFTYIVIPLFMLMGELAFESGISRDLFRAASAWTGRMPGGLAVASISGCAAFAAVCGESLATAVTMTSTALPEMRRKGYDPAFSCATLAAGGTLGILIPPSTGFIFYAIITEVSIGRLFLGGVLPGLLLALLFVFVVLAKAWLRPETMPQGKAVPWREKFASLKGTVGMLLLILLILGGILSGKLSPNEGGAVGAAGALAFALARRSITLKSLMAALARTTNMTAKLLLILFGVTILGYFLAATRLPFALADFIVGLEASRYFILLAIIAFYIVMGCIMSVIPMMLLTLPALFPTIVQLGFDPVWFGVTVVVLMEMGLITPPIGVNVFGICGMAPDVPMGSIFRQIIPFCLAMLLCLGLLIVFPQIALWLPNTFL